MIDLYSTCPDCGARLIWNPWTHCYESQRWKPHRCQPERLSLHIAPCGCVVKGQNGEYSTVKSCETHRHAA